MAFYSKKDFAVHCGISTRELAVYVKRNKVVASGEFFDDSLSLNKEFIEKCKVNAAKRGHKVEPVSEKKEKPLRMIRPDPEANLPHPPEIPNIEESEFEEDLPEDTALARMPITTLNKKKIKVEIEERTERTALLKIRKDQLHGILIPTELVKMLFTQHSKSIQVEFTNAVNNVLSIIQKRKDLSKEEAAQIKGELIETINQAVDKSVETSHKQIKSIVKDLAVKKKVGERG